MREERDNTTTVILVATFGALGVALCGCGIPFFAAILIPNVARMQYPARRAEAPANVDGIKTAQLAYEAAFDEYVETPPSPRPDYALSKEPARWAYTPEWKQLGWAPDGDVRGSYRVEVSPDGSDFTVFGIIDVDGDGIPAVYTATKSVNTMFLNRNDTF